MVLVIAPSCSSGCQEGSGEAGEGGMGVTLGTNVECGRSHSLGARSMATMGKSGEVSLGSSSWKAAPGASEGLEGGAEGSEGDQGRWCMLDFTLGASAVPGFRSGTLSGLVMIGGFKDEDHIQDSGGLLLPREPVTSKKL